jgi:hypothetical protein
MVTFLATLNEEFFYILTKIECFKMCLAVGIFLVSRVV